MVLSPERAVLVLLGITTGVSVFGQDMSVSNTNFIDLDGTRCAFQKMVYSAWCHSTARCTVFVFSQCSVQSSTVRSTVSVLSIQKVSEFKIRFQNLSLFVNKTNRLANVHDMVIKCSTVWTNKTWLQVRPGTSQPIFFSHWVITAPWEVNACVYILKPLAQEAADVGLSCCDYKGFLLLDQRNNIYIQINLNVYTNGLFYHYIEYHFRSRGVWSTWNNTSNIPRTYSSLQSWVPYKCQDTLIMIIEELLHFGQ